MGMLSAYDIAWMEDTVRDIIKEWRTKIKIYSRLPLEDQPNYNHLMKEFVGDSYCTFIEIDAERKDIVNNMTNDPDIYEMDYGKKDNGALLFAIPNVIEDEQYKPSLFDIVTIAEDGNVYYIRNIRDRIGETLLTLGRFTGNIPKIETIEVEIPSEDEEEEPVKEERIVIKDYDWSGLDG